MTSKVPSFTAAAAVLILALPAQAVLPSQYHLQDLGLASWAEHVNANGVVSGHDIVAEPQPWLWADGNRTFLEDPLSEGDALGVNSSGVAVGYLVAPRGAYGHAMKWTSPGSVTDIGTQIPSNSSEATAINDNGDCVIYGFVSGTAHSYLSTGCTGDSPEDIGSLGADTFAYGINANGQITGQSSLSTGSARAFLYSNGQMQDLGVLPNYTSSTARGLNGKGHVAGFSVGQFNHWMAFLYRGDRLTALGTLGGHQSGALAVNYFDVVVGLAQTKDKQWHAFVRDMGIKGQPMRNLEDMLDASGAGWKLQEAVGINNAGQILVHGETSDGSHSALLTPLP